MARITVEDCLTKENNRFALVQLAAKRTKQLLTGARVLLGEQRGNKAVVTALREIASGQVRFMSPEEFLEKEERLAKEAEARAEAASASRASSAPVEAGLFKESVVFETGGETGGSESGSVGSEAGSGESGSGEEPASVNESGASHNGETIS